MDPFSIALGVLQLTGVAVKVSLVLKKKIKVFRNYSRELSRVLKGVNRQQKNFLHETHLLLRLAKQDEDDIDRMLEDADHPRWTCRELQAGLHSAFPSSLDTVQDIIEEIRSTLQALHEELACFDGIAEMGAKARESGGERRFHTSNPAVFVCLSPNQYLQNESLQDTVRRVRKRVKITWNKSSLDEKINILRELNNDLRRLREQATEIKEPVLRNKACVRATQQLSQEYGSIGKVRRASKAFHQALAAAWLKQISKTQHGEVRHNVKLKLDTQVRDEVKMEVVIACYGHSGPQP